MRSDGCNTAGEIAGISDGTLVEILQKLPAADSTVSAEATLALLLGWLRRTDHVLAGTLETTAWNTLELPTTWSGQAMMVFYWKEIALKLVEKDPPRMAHLIGRMFLDLEYPLYHDERLEVLKRALQLSPISWQRIGGALLAAKQPYKLTWALREMATLSQVPHEPIVGWLQGRDAKTARVIAEAVKPEGEKLSELIRFLLANYGDSVTGILAGNYLSGSWAGAESNYLRTKATSARAWLEDPDPAVKEWVTKLIASINDRIRRAKAEEEDEDEC